MQPWPYPMVHNGRTIDDEMCKCGHPRSQHADTITVGHGGCGARALTVRCPCDHFVFRAFVFREERHPMSPADYHAILAPLAESLAVTLRAEGLTLCTLSGIPVESTSKVCERIARDALQRFVKELP